MQAAEGGGGLLIPVPAGVSVGHGAGVAQVNVSGYGVFRLGTAGLAVIQLPDSLVTTYRIEG